MDLLSTIKGSLLEGFFPAGWDLARMDACCSHGPPTLNGIGEATPAQMCESEESRGEEETRRRIEKIARAGPGLGPYVYPSPG